MLNNAEKDATERAKAKRFSITSLFGGGKKILEKSAERIGGAILSKKLEEEELALHCHDSVGNHYGPPICFVFKTNISETKKISMFGSSGHNDTRCVVI